MFDGCLADTCSDGVDGGLSKQTWEQEPRRPERKLQLFGLAKARLKLSQSDH
jgi:hypothetical protein